MVVQQGRIARQWTYYDLPYGQPLLQGTEADIVEELREQLESAVKRQMVADVPVGAFLSGGLDSSAIVAMMRRVRPDYVPICYSIGFAGDSQTEDMSVDLPYAKRVAKNLGYHPIEKQPSSRLRAHTLLYGQPQADPLPSTPF
jgi:asparagine synthase (glutamine-hydrolysing)